MLGYFGWGKKKSSVQDVCPQEPTPEHQNVCGKEHRCIHKGCRKSVHSGCYRCQDHYLKCKQCRNVYNVFRFIGKGGLCNTCTGNKMKCCSFCGEMLLIVEGEEIRTCATCGAALVLEKCSECRKQKPMKDEEKKLCCDCVLPCRGKCGWTYRANGKLSAPDGPAGACAFHDVEACGGQHVVHTVYGEMYLAGCQRYTTFHKLAKHIAQEVLDSTPLPDVVAGIVGEFFPVMCFECYAVQDKVELFHQLAAKVPSSPDAVSIQNITTRRRKKKKFIDRKPCDDSCEGSD